MSEELYRVKVIKSRVCYYDEDKEIIFMDDTPFEEVSLKDLRELEELCRYANSNLKAGYSYKVLSYTSCEVEEMAALGRATLESLREAKKLEEIKKEKAAAKRKEATLERKKKQLQRLTKELGEENL